MAKCEICGKGPQFGNSVSHSMRHTKRRFNANIQKTTILKAGRPEKVRICTRCLRTMNKA